MFMYKVGNILQWKPSIDPIYSGPSESFEITGINSKNNSYSIQYLSDLDLDTWPKEYIEKRAEPFPLELKEKNYSIE